MRLRTSISYVFVVVLLAEQFLVAEGIVKTDNENTHFSKMSSESEFASKVKKNCHDNDNANGDCLSTKSNEQETTNSRVVDPPYTSSNKGKLGTSHKATYEVISKSIMANGKRPLFQECDDEDDCNSEYSGSGIDGDSGKELSESNSEYSIITRGLFPPKIKNSRGVDPSYTSSNKGKLGTSHKATYEVISKSIIENGKRPLSIKECDNEDDCNSEYSGSGSDGDNGKELSESNSEYSVITRGLSPPKIKQTTLQNSHSVDPSYSSSNRGKLGTSHKATYEVISKSIMENRKRPLSKECDDEDDCNSEYSGSGNDFDNGKELSESNSEYSVITRGLSPPLKIKNSRGVDPSYTSSNKGKLGTSHKATYEVISKSIIENGKRPLSKECDDEDDCNSSFSGSGYNVYDGNGVDGDNIEKSIAEYFAISRRFSPPKRTKQIALENSNAMEPPSKSSDTGTLETSHEAVYEVISKSIMENRRANEIIICDKNLCGDSAFCMFNRKTNKAECICSTSKGGVHCSEDATFFVGISFLVFPPLGERAQEYVEVEMSIMPLERSGLIIYNGWQPQRIGDFISLSLQNGFVELRFNCGSGMVIIRSMKTVIMKRWHNIKFYRSERLGSLTVNSNPPVLGYSPGPRSIMSLHQNLLVGGISDDVKHEVNVNAGINKGFTGLIQNLKINGVELNLISNAVHRHNENENEKADPCLSSPCVNGATCLANREEYSCLCISYYGGRNCEKEVNLKAMAFNSESYILFNVSGLLKVLNVQNTTVNFFMKTTESKGLILWEIQKVYRRLKRYFAMSLKTGRILLSYDFGFGKKMVYSSLAINDGHWHKIMINKRASFGTLIIDEKHQMEFKANVYHSEQETRLYIGGAPDVTQDTKGMINSGFKGCLKNLQIRNQYIDFVHDVVAAKDMEKCAEN